MAEEPQGVRIVHRDGTETPCTLTYLGQDEGVDGWRINEPVDLAAGDHIEVAVCPARSAIEFGRKPRSIIDVHLPT
jgi:hypothetical protein